MTAAHAIDTPSKPMQTPTEKRDLRKTGLHPDHWYPLARARDIKRGKPYGTQFAGEPIVIVRTATGTLFALEDRCAHRQVPLSGGTIEGELLQCGYHCWTYDASGACVSVPYIDKEKTLPNGVRGYPCREAYGLIFVFMGDAEKSATATFPQVPAFNDRRYKTRFLDRRVECHYSFMHENLMDMNHQFLHRKLMGGIKTLFLELREGDDWIEADYTFRRTRGRQPIGERLMIGKSTKGRDGKKQDLMTIRTEYPYQTLRFWKAGSKDPELTLWNFYIPVDRQQRINHTYGLMSIRTPSIPGLIHLMWPLIAWFTDSIFAEDRDIVELEQKAFDNQGADWNQEVFPTIQKLRGVLIRQGVPIDE